MFRSPRDRLTPREMAEASEPSAATAPIMALFWCVAVAHLVLSGLHQPLARTITKCFLAPLLAFWVSLARPRGSGPVLLLVALVFCFLGDLFLELPAAMFVPGMAVFAMGHVCFVRMFVERGAMMVLRRRPWIVLPYVGAAVGMVVWAWPGLKGGMHVAVPCYAVLLLATAATSMAASWQTGLGGALFLLSDGLILLNQSGRINNKTAPWRPDVLIMLLYILAIWLLSFATVHRERASIQASVTAGTDSLYGLDLPPHLRARCWPRIPRTAMTALTTPMLSSEIGGLHGDVLLRAAPVNAARS